MVLIEVATAFGGSAQAGYLTNSKLRGRKHGDKITHLFLLDGEVVI